MNNNQEIINIDNTINNDSEDTIDIEDNNAINHNINFIAFDTELISTAI